MAGHFFELAQNKYSRFLVTRFIESANKTQRESIYKEFFGNVLTMIKHKVRNPLPIARSHLTKRWAASRMLVR